MHDKAAKSSIGQVSQAGHEYTASQFCLAEGTDLQFGGSGTSHSKAFQVPNNCSTNQQMHTATSQHCS